MKIKKAVKVSKMGKKSKSQFKSVGQFLVKALTSNLNMKLESIIIEVKKIDPTSKFATNKKSAVAQYRWYKSAIKSGRIKGVLTAKKALKHA